MQRHLTNGRRSGARSNDRDRPEPEPAGTSRILRSLAGRVVRAIMSSASPLAAGGLAEAALELLSSADHDFRPLEKFVGEIEEFALQALRYHSEVYDARPRADILVNNGDSAAILQGITLSDLRKSNYRSLKRINMAEFKVFSQFGEDGIIDALVEILNIPVCMHRFVEFGVQDYSEANTRFLLEHRNWSGFVLDGDKDSIRKIRTWEKFWKYDLVAEHAHITAENINDILQKYNFSSNVGILSIDVDGVDYWIWKSIEVCAPPLVIIEYNAIYGSELAVTVPYSPDFYRGMAHYSHLYAGASLKALQYLGIQKGYTLVGCNSAGCNAFFVRDDYAKKIPWPLEDLFVNSKFRESRDRNGVLDFRSGQDRIKIISEMPVVDVTTNRTFQLKDLVNKD